MPELGGEATRRLLQASGIGDYVIETGFKADQILTPAQMGEAAGAGYAEVVRVGSGDPDPFS